jgi:serine/threonine protein kinase
MTAPWTIGETIEGRWEVHQILKGGMGVVYIVYDREHRTPYAAKSFRDDKVENSDSINSFIEEALTWVNLDVHENVARAEFVETILGRPFLFLEFISGGDLSRWIGTPRLTDDLPQVLRFAIQFCDGMIHAAAKGIEVHRDIKPRNCLITEDLTLKVTDFGLAKVFRDPKAAGPKNERPAKKQHDLAPSETCTGTGAGTCTHMAPEQFEDAKQVDARADIYSFGVLLFQMLTGKLPFDGDTYDELKQQHQTQAPPALPSSFPPLLIETVNSCLRKNPLERFRDFFGLRQQLAEIYAKVTGIQAPQPIVGAKLDAVEWSNKGASLHNLQRHTEALNCYEHALGLNPQLKEAWNNKGLVLRDLGRYAEALPCYDQALAIDQDFVLAWNNKGSTLEIVEGHAEALDCYEHALGLNPRFKEAWNNKGRVLRSLGRFSEAVACYDEALAVDSQNAEIWAHKGSSLGGSGRHAEALACYDQALILDANNVEVWSQRGRSLQALGRHSEALASYSQAFTLNPNIVTGRFRRWAAVALLSCQRLLNVSSKPRDQQRCSMS